MTIPDDHLPKQPKQERGWRKFELILQTAVDLINDGGVDKVSIPSISTRAKIPLSSVYQFFPTHYAVLVELARRHNDKLNDQLVDTLRNTDLDQWQKLFTTMIDVVVDYSRKNPVAQALFLSPIVPKDVMDVSADSDDKLNIAIIGLLPKEIINALLRAQQGLDPIRVTIELVLTVFSISYRNSGEITDHAVEEAKRAGIGYLTTYVEGITTH